MSLLCAAHKYKIVLKVKFAQIKKPNYSFNLLFFPANISWNRALVTSFNEILLKLKLPKEIKFTTFAFIL
jgi:hypothetical protein